MQENQIVEESTPDKFYVKRRQDYIKYRSIILNGGENCIPCPFPRLSKAWAGIERKKTYLITGNQKSGKSKFAMYLFVLHPLWYAYTHRYIKVKIIIFSLEMAKEQLYDMFTVWWLYKMTNGKINIDVDYLNSIRRDRPLDDSILELLVTPKFTEFFDFIEEHIDIDTVNRNPYGMYKKCKDYAEENGTTYYKPVIIKDEITGQPKTMQIKDYYVPNTDEYRIVVYDHVSLISVERGMTLRDSMKKMFSRDMMELRNVYGYTNVPLQQQNLQQEGIDNYKLAQLKPSATGLETYKDSSKDVDMMIGIFDPFRHNLPSYEKYRIVDGLKNKQRFIEIILNRTGTAGNMTALYFNGASNIFYELPPATHPDMSMIYHKITNNEL